MKRLILCAVLMLAGCRCNEHSDAGTEDATIATPDVPQAHPPLMDGATDIDASEASQG